MSDAKGRSKCTMTLTTPTPTSVEGPADCPVIDDTAGSGTGSLPSVTVAASTN